MSYHSTITDFSWTSTYQEKLDLAQNRLNQFEIDKDKDIIKAEKDFNIKHTHLNHIKDLLLDINTHRLCKQVISSLVPIELIFIYRVYLV